VRYSGRLGNEISAKELRRRYKKRVHAIPSYSLNNSSSSIQGGDVQVQGSKFVFSISKSSSPFAIAFSAPEVLHLPFIGTLLPVRYIFR
jgi:hypothetical protein